jgi:hypothetical protein
MERDPRIDAIAASDLSSAAILAALTGALGAKGVLSDDEGREIYEQAQYLLETHQGDEPEARSVYEAAREIIEAQLLPDEG